MSCRDVARKAWGNPMPDWIEALAEACDRSSQVKVASRIGYSGAALSGVLSGSYKGNFSRVEQAVRGALLHATVACPALGQAIGTNACLDHQRTPFSTISPQAVRLARTCPNCPNREPERKAL